jgi:nitric oxide reductase NorQ protein
MKHVSNIGDSKLDDVKRAIKLSKTLRDAAAVEELYYSPSIRETIAFTRLLNTGIQPKKAAEIVFANAYDQWGEVEFRKVMDMVISIFGD